MKPIESILLGIVQGISEFLPVSSSAHLILTSRLLGWADQGLAFDMAANTGSLLAVMVYLRREIWEIARGLGERLARLGSDRAHGLATARPAMLLAVATLPVGVGGLLARGLIADLARDPVVIAVTSILFALALWWADTRKPGDAYLADITVAQALLIGLAQAMALVPGTSRAGVTLTAALLLGLKRETAVRFSFLMAVPVGVLVAAKQGTELALAAPESVAFSSLTLGLMTAAISAYAAIAWLISWVRRQSLLVFVLYRLLLGGAILLGALL